MRRIQIIRSRLGLSQTELAEAVGRTQPQISAFERGATIPPEVATRLIEAARERGLAIGYDHVYGEEPIPYIRPEKQRKEIDHQLAQIHEQLEQLHDDIAQLCSRISPAQTQEEKIEA